MWQTASDIIIFFGWFFENASTILVQIFSPIRYIFTFTKNFFVSAFAPPESYEEIWTFPNSILGIFDSIPYWDTLIVVLGVGLMLIFGIVILKVFLRT
ncbi:unnamed protein product [marine sediment metagenome]|uniref:Uncharacterized protein n=1 Tax=marine sediment metagenome TaxID=412755 RepID=X1KC56_9ZZZZ